MLLAEQNGNIWPLVGVMAAMVLFLFSIWRISRRAASRGDSLWPKAPGGGAGLPHGVGTVPGRGLTVRSSPADAPPSLTAWEVHMHETARELCGLVDTKLRVLQQLVAEADRAATRLERALAASESVLKQSPLPGQREDTDFSKRTNVPQTIDLPPPEPTSRFPPEAPSHGQPVVAACPKVSDSQPPSAPAEPAWPSSGVSATSGPASTVRPEALALEVGLLADYGFPLEEIASRCGIRLPEVEAILRQRNQQNQKGSE